MKDKKIYLSINSFQKLIDKLELNKKQIENACTKAVNRTLEIGYKSTGEDDKPMYKSARTEPAKLEGKKIIGILKADDGARFAEYGTGNFSTKGHIGNTPSFIRSNMNTWYIPVASVKKELPFKIVKRGEVEYYEAHPQAPQRVFYYAGENMKKALKDELNKALKEEIK